jgi:hypothetical protein
MLHACINPWLRASIDLSVDLPELDILSCERMSILQRMHQRAPIIRGQFINEREQRGLCIVCVFACATCCNKQLEREQGTASDRAKVSSPNDQKGKAPGLIMASAWIRKNELEQRGTNFGVEL